MGFGAGFHLIIAGTIIKSPWAYFPNLFAENPLNLGLSVLIGAILVALGITVVGKDIDHVRQSEKIMLYAACIFPMLAVFDTATTQFAVNTFGSHVEFNPLVRAIIEAGLGIHVIFFVTTLISYFGYGVLITSLTLDRKIARPMRLASAIVFSYSGGLAAFAPISNTLFLAEVSSHLTTTPILVAAFALAVLSFLVVYVLRS